MFTGIVEELGEVTDVAVAADAARLGVRGPVVTADARHGDSLAVNGVCLTVADCHGEVFTADVMRETLVRSNLARLVAGDRVNLERAVAVGQRLGGHLVQGHVDGTGVVLERRATPHWTAVRVSLPAGLARYVVEKGSIAVDGVSLTVTGVAGGTADGGEASFTVGLIPTTLASTTLAHREVGDVVNLEADVLAKYVERLVGPHRGAVVPAGPAGADTGSERTEEPR